MGDILNDAVRCHCLFYTWSWYDAMFDITPVKICIIKDRRNPGGVGKSVCGGM